MYREGGAPIIWLNPTLHKIAGVPRHPSFHCSLFPAAAVIEKFKNELKGYTVSKGTIQFPTDKPLPAGLVKKMVKARVAQIENKKRH